MLDKLCLGTVQLGMSYGINNVLARKPTREESFSVLQAAVEKGITSFDTASVYGNAEAVLGSFAIGRYRVKITSKLRPGLGDDPHVSVIENVEREVAHSLKKLHVQFLDGYLLHDAKDFYREDIMKGLQLCKDKGMLKNIGVSVYEVEDALQAVKSGQIDYIQIPYNVFDQRLDATNFFAIAKRNKVTVFARSAFLQGLLLMNIEEVPSYLDEAKVYLKEYEQIVSAFGFTKKEAAFLFSLCHQGIDKVVFGVDSVGQLEQNLSIMEKTELFHGCCAELEACFRNRQISRKIILPSLWR